MLVVIAALGLAGSAAYFSISGLSKLFAGSAMQVIIMASFIEFSKIITTAALHRYWKSMKTVPMKILKWFLTIMVLVVMAITSSGIYGFLADAYSTTSMELEKIDGQIELVEKQQDQKKQQIVGIEEIKQTKTERIGSLIELRTQQEARIDSLYNKGWYNSAKKTQELIDQSTREVQGLQNELDSLANRINGINEEIGEMDIKILDLQNTDVATEIGPLKYMSTVLERPMENIINWFILMIIVVFDPLAILLVVFANVIYDKAIGKEEPKKEKKKGLFSRFRERFDSKKDSQGEVFEETYEQADEEGKGDAYEGPSEEDQRVIDAVNSDNPDIFDLSYDFPSEKEDEVFEYVSGEDGEFKKSENEDQPKNIAEIIRGIDSNPLYINLIDVLYNDGNRKSGDIVPPYKAFLQEVRSRNIQAEEKVVKNFITVCNLLTIIDMRDKDNVKIIKDYSSAKQIISLVSK